MGLAFRALRQEQIAAASGTTDFGQLFIGFSFFIIVAAALLVAMLMRLNVEQRARQIGAMSALGFSPGSLKRIMLLEGMLLAIAGGVVGSAAAIAYTWLMMAALRSWWFGAVGTTSLRLHVEPGTLVIGFVMAQIVAIFAILWGVRQVGRASPARLLAGGSETLQSAARSSVVIIRWIGAVGVLVGLGTIFSGATGTLRQQDAFLISGAILLMS
jgi:ABC-type antimicrobial peptide transport system permease subunit